MNKTGTIKSSDPIGPLGSSEKNKQWQRELLMERLRSHSTQHKTFPEYSRSMRMSMLEKRYALDAVEKSNLQKCLDSMQHCIKVTTRQGLVERLESLSRQLGLKFMEDTAGLFISSDMFYLEIILDNDGKLRDVKVHHECKIEQQSCIELVQCLLNGDFADFTVQLEGLSSIYQLNAEPKVKSKAFVALQAMETDLYNLFQIQQFHKDMFLTLMDSTVGIVLRRRGGHSMKLLYYIPPYDLLNLELQTMQPLTIDLISTKPTIGMSVSVNLEASSANKLQILPTIIFNKDNNMQSSEAKTIPIYSPMDSMNSTLLPATFVLRLNKPLPICKSLLNTLTHLNNDNNILNKSGNQKHNSIMDLIVQIASDGQIKSDSNLYVNLPDQNHVYYFIRNKEMEGTIVSSIPFTEPSQVPKILSVLKKQAIFHTLLASCVRPFCKIGDLDIKTELQVQAISISHVSVSLEHPKEQITINVEFNLNDGKNIICNICSNSISSNYDMIASKLSKIVQKSLSIPIAIRTLLKYWEQENFKGFNRGLENGSNFNFPSGPNDPGGGGSGRGGNMDYRNMEMKIKTERGMGGNISSGVNSGSSSGGRQYFQNNNEMQYLNTSSTNNSHYNKINREISGIGSGGGGGNGMGMVATGTTKGYPGEDFSKNPKSSNNSKAETFCNNFTEISGDSSSLGDTTKTKSESGVTTAQNCKKTNNTSTDSKSSNSNNNKEKSTKQYENMKSSTTKSNKTISITPMSANELTSVLTGMGLEKRPGIEIIPISSTNTQNFQTSITITPINVSKSDKKHGNSSSVSKRTSNDESKTKTDKKRKRKKDDTGQMGPPEKIISKSSDSLNRTINSASSMSSIKKDQSSVSPNRSGKHSTSSSPSMNYSMNSNSATKPSPKHSPIYSSPKSQSGQSPKYTISGSSGKPSMLALKSVTNSATSPKGDKTSQKLQSKDKDKDKERNSKNLNTTSTGTSPKIKSSAVKLKQIDLNTAFLQQLESAGTDESKILASHLAAATGDELISLNALTGAVAAAGGITNSLLQSKIRKGSLSAVIDKLKLAQNSGDEILSDLSHKFDIGSAEVNTSNYKMTSSNSTAFGSSEYMIKPSLDGMKITINKTRTKEAASSSNLKISSPSISSSMKFPASSGNPSISPKKHTGLKPGVLSGPASKKNVTNSPSLVSGSQTKTNFQRTSSGGNLTTKIGSTDLYRRDKSIKSKTSMGTGGDAKQVSNRPPDPMDVIKILRLNSPNNSMDGFMKSLNTKFQIPKLSARSSDDSKKDSNIATSAQNSVSSIGVSSTTLTTTTSLTTSSGIGSGSAEPINKFSNENATKLQQPSQQHISSKIPSSSALSTASEAIINQQIQSALGKVSHLLQSNNSFVKDFTQQQKQLSKSSSSDAIPNSFQRDYNIKSYSSSTPTTPMHVPSPFTSPIGGVLTNSSPSSAAATASGYKPSPSTSPNLLLANIGSSGSITPHHHHNDNITMRPPSAPCTVDMTKVTTMVDQLRSSTSAAFTSNNKSSLTKKLVSSSSSSPSSSSTINNIATSSLASLSSQKLSLSLSPSTIVAPVGQQQQQQKSSSVSIHIVKSPAPSPLMLLSSPHSNSPCIVDEEIIDGK